LKGSLRNGLQGKCEMFFELATVRKPVPTLANGMGVAYFPLLIIRINCDVNMDRARYSA